MSAADLVHRPRRRDRVRQLEYAAALMVRGVRRVALTAAAIACFVAASPAPAQTGGGAGGEPFSGPLLDDKFPGGKGAQKTPTPTPPTPEPTAEETETPEPTASPEPTATAKPNGRRNDKKLPNTGSDALRIGLMGLTLLGFGFSLRLGLAEAGRRD